MFNKVPYKLAFVYLCFGPRQKTLRAKVQWTQAPCTQQKYTYRYKPNDKIKSQFKKSNHCLLAYWCFNPFTRNDTF